MIRAAFLTAVAVMGIVSGADAGASLRLVASPPTASQIARDPASAADLLGTVLTDADGQVLGTVSDLLVDAGRRRVAFIGVRRSSPGEIVALPWVPLVRRAAAKAGYAVTRAAATAGDLPFAQQAAADPAFLDVRRDLLGRPVLAAAGENIGRLVDFDVDLRSGAIGHLFIATAEMADRDTGLRAISWDAIADLDNQRAIVLSLGARDVLASPVTSLAAHRPSGGSAGDPARG